MSRTAVLSVLVGMGAVASCTFPGWRACGGLGRPWLWSRACLVLWPSYLNLFSLGGRDAKDTQSFSARAQETGLRESGPDAPSWVKGVRARVALLEPPTVQLAT